TPLQDGYLLLDGCDRLAVATDGSGRRRILAESTSLDAFHSRCLSGRAVARGPRRLSRADDAARAHAAGLRGGRLGRRATRGAKPRTRVWRQMNTSIFKPRRVARLLVSDARNVKRDPTLLFAFILSVMPALLFGLWHAAWDTAAETTLGISNISRFL